MGALSSTLESAPEAQKNCQGWVIPSVAPRSARYERAGTMVTKTPRKITATSTIGAQLKRFAVRISWAVVIQDRAANAAIPRHLGCRSERARSGTAARRTSHSRTQPPRCRAATGS